MPNHDDHVKVLDKKITELSDALAHLGRGTDLKELIKELRAERPAAKPRPTAGVSGRR